MVFPEGCSEGTLGPISDNQSTVCLLDVDAMDELHNVPLDADQPPAPEGSAPECVVQNLSAKETPITVGNYPDYQCSRCALYSWIFLFTFAVFVVLINLALSLYMMYQHAHEKEELQQLIERLDAQSQILRQIAANQILAGYNPGGL